MKPIKVKHNTYIDSINEVNNKDLKFKIEYQNTKLFLLKNMLQIALKKFL